MNNNYSNIQERLKKDSIKNASYQGITYTEPPKWISSVSWGFAGLCGLITFFALLEEKGVGALLAGVVIFLISKAITYIILNMFFEGSKFVKKGAIVVANKSSEMIDSATTNISRKITSAVEKGKEEAKIEQEKQILREKIKDLELQKLKNRIKELEKDIYNKNQKK